MTDAETIYQELQGLAKQRRASELKLRQIDQQRQEGARRGPPPNHYAAPVTGANASRIGGDSAPPTEREGPPKEGRWKHDGGADFSSSWQGGGRERGGERLQGRLGPLREDRPRIVQSVVSAVSKPDEDEGGKSKEGDKEERPASGRKRGGEERDEDNKRHFSDERPAKAMRGERDEDRRAGRDEDRRERPQRPAWREGLDTSRLPRHNNRISSVVAVGHGDGEQSEFPKPRGQHGGSEKDKKRNRKMFGALLGHLKKAKKEEEVLVQTPVMQKRIEMDVKAETKAAESSQQLRYQIRQERIEERRRQLDTIRNVRQKQQAALHTLTVVRADGQCKSLSNYIRTSTKPAIFWMPKKMSGVQDLVKKTADMLGGELLLLKDKLNQERAEDVAAEQARQKEIEERIATAREMAAQRERAFTEGGWEAGLEGVGKQDGQEDHEDTEGDALKKAVEDEGGEEAEEEEEDNVLDIDL